MQKVKKWLTLVVAYGTPNLMYGFLPPAATPNWTLPIVVCFSFGSDD